MEKNGLHTMDLLTQSFTVLEAQLCFEFTIRTKGIIVWSRTYKNSTYLLIKLT